MSLEEMTEKMSLQTVGHILCKLFKTEVNNKTDDVPSYGTYVKLSRLNLFLNNRENVTVKRNDYLEWEEYFMAVAFLAAKRSKDPNCQVGACIVNEDKKVVGIGYNGMPLGCSDDEFPWGKNDDKENKFLYVCHAELNAIVNKNLAELKGCTIYVSLFPCNECAKLIIQSRISHVIYVSDENAHTIKVQASKRMFDAAGVTYRQLKPKHKKIEIDFGIE